MMTRTQGRRPGSAISSRQPGRQEFAAYCPAGGVGESSLTSVAKSTSQVKDITPRERATQLARVHHIVITNSATADSTAAEQDRKEGGGYGANSFPPE